LRQQTALPNVTPKLRFWWIASANPHYIYSPYGCEKRYNPRGFVVENTGNAIWGMQFIWPFKSEFIIAYLDKDYTSTIIARNARDYVWIMARTPFINDSRYQELI